MNWTTIKTGVFAMGASLVVLGYAASQWFYFQGKSAEYARAVDTPAVQMLSLVLLVTMVLLRLVPTSSEDEA